MLGAVALVVALALAGDLARRVRGRAAACMRIMSLCEVWDIMRRMYRRRSRRARAKLRSWNASRSAT